MCCCSTGSLGKRFHLQPSFPGVGSSSEGWCIFRTWQNCSLPARPQKIAPNLCSLGRLKPNLREAWLFLKKLGSWQFFINKWAVGNLNNTFYCLQLQSSPAATNDSNQYLQQGISYFSSTSSGDSWSSGELCCQRSTWLDQWVSPI